MALIIYPRSIKKGYSKGTTQKMTTFLIIYYILYTVAILSANYEQKMTGKKPKGHHWKAWSQILYVVAYKTILS